MIDDNYHYYEIINILFDMHAITYKNNKLITEMTC